MSNFAFLQSEWPDLHEAASKAESLVHTNRGTACLYARRALEAAMVWLYKYDAKLKLQPVVSFRDDRFSSGKLEI